MKRITIGTIIMMGIALTACQKPNPLVGQDLKAIASILKESNSLTNSICAVVWANPKTANAKVTDGCENQAFLVAIALKNKGYGEINADNIKIPALWKNYLSIKDNSPTANKYSPKKAGNAMKLAPKNSLGDRIEAYKQQKEDNQQ